MVGPEIIDTVGVMGRRFDQVVTVPYGSDIIATDNTLTPVLTRLSEWSGQASSGILERNPQAEWVILGETPYGEGMSNTADLLAEMPRAENQRITKLTVTHSGGDWLNDTSLQMRALAEYLRMQGNDTGEGVVATALGYHARRVGVHAAAFGLGDMVIVPAEVVLRKDGHMAKEEPYFQALSNGAGLSEQLCLAAARFDPRGTLFFDPLARSRGARVINVTGPPDNIQFTCTTAQRRKEEALLSLRTRVAAHTCG